MRYLNYSVISPLLAKPKWTLGLHSVCLSVQSSVRPSVSVFWAFFLITCRYWPDFWHGNQFPCFTDWIWVSLRSIDFWRNYGPGLSKFQQSNSFPDFFPKSLQILTWFLAWNTITMFYRLSLSFVTLHRFLAKLRALDLVNFSDQTVFQTFFRNACRYWPDFWHVSQSPWFTDQVWVLLRSIDFWPYYGPWT